MTALFGLLLMAGASGLDTFLEEAVRKGDIPGVVVVAEKNGKTVFSKAAGYADRESKRPMRVDDIFMMASTSKPVSATAILTLVDGKKLSLDDPVRKYFAEFGGDATVRQLLSHTSGIFGNVPDHPRLKYIRDLDRTLAEAVSLIVREPLAYEPGTRYSYGGASFCVAGRIAEMVTGEEFDAFARRVIFAPLGMKETVFRTEQDLSARIPKIYRKAEGQWVATPAITDTAERRGPRAKGLVLVPGSLYSTAADMLRFARLHLDGGRNVLSRGMVAEMRRKQTGALKENYGLGWQLLGNGAFGHGGAYGTYLYVDAAHGGAAVILTQSVGAGGFLEAVRKQVQQLLAAD